MGRGPSQLLDRLITLLGCLQWGSAKQQQKLWDLNHVVLPQLYYHLVHSRANKGTLRRMDCKTRKFIWAALHLPMDCKLQIES